ncbi:ribonuclease toxin immunity protein CdiI [Lysinibacillus sp. 3P01SB]|uniref:ribonuclease toxin immunity protein CdiI n=1 Tax=Lysinibacillus sp. 3P01SB TaxID=3132284 RepID=UPI0039A59A4F
MSNESKLMELYYFAIGDGNFLKALNRYCNRQGFGNEHIWCLFAGELEEWEEGYFGKEGVCYFFDYPAVEEDQTIVLDYPTFYNYLKEASAKYLLNHPNDKNEVEERLEKIKEMLHILK